MWVCKDVIWLVCVQTLDVTGVLVSLHLKLGSEWLGAPSADNTGIQQLRDVRTKSKRINLNTPNGCDYMWWDRWKGFEFDRERNFGSYEISKLLNSPLMQILGTLSKNF